MNRPRAHPDDLIHKVLAVSLETLAIRTTDLVGGLDITPQTLDFGTSPAERLDSIVSFVLGTAFDYRDKITNFPSDEADPRVIHGLQIEFVSAFGQQTISPIVHRDSGDLSANESFQAERLDAVVYAIFYPAMKLITDTIRDPEIASSQQAATARQDLDTSRDTAVAAVQLSSAPIAILANLARAALVSATAISGRPVQPAQQSSVAALKMSLGFPGTDETGEPKP